MITMEHTLAEQLTDLMVVNNERGESYEVAGKGSAGSDLKSLFGMMASHSRRFGRELLEEVRHR